MGMKLKGTETACTRFVAGSIPVIAIGKCALGNADHAW